MATADNGQGISFTFSSLLYDSELRLSDSAGESETDVTVSVSDE